MRSIEVHEANGARLFQVNREAAFGENLNVAVGFVQKDTGALTEEPQVPEPYTFFTTPEEKQAYFEAVGEIYFDAPFISDDDAEMPLQKTFTMKKRPKRGPLGVHPQLVSEDMRRHNAELKKLYDYRLQHGSDVHAYLSARQPTPLLQEVTTTETMPVSISEPVQLFPTDGSSRAAGDE